MRRLRSILLGLLWALGLACGSSGATAGAGGAGGTGGGAGGTGGGAGGSGASVCYDSFHPLPDGGYPVGVCCPEQSPDCSQVPDGSVDFPNGSSSGAASAVDYCLWPANFNCECACHGSQWVCLLDGAPAAYCGPSTK
jgi:hypothetical protein